MSARTQSRVHADMGVRADASPSPPSPPGLPSAVRTDAGLRPRGREKKYKIKLKNKIYFLLKKNFGSYCRLGKREKIFNFQFSIFNFRFSIPKLPKLPELPELPELRGLRGRSREKKKVFSA
jgi:hypothetical protein